MANNAITFIPVAFAVLTVSFPCWASFVCICLWWRNAVFPQKEGAVVANLMEREVWNGSCIDHVFVDILSKLVFIDTLSRLLSGSEKCFTFSCPIYWLDLWVSKGSAFLHSKHQICSASSHGGWHQGAHQECPERTIHCSVVENLQTLILERLWFYSPQHYTWKG